MELVTPAHSLVSESPSKSRFSLIAWSICFGSDPEELSFVPWGGQVCDAGDSW